MGMSDSFGKPGHTELLSRRALLWGVAASPAMGVGPGDSPGGLPSGAALRVKPVLVWQLATRKEQTSWRGYGGLETRQDVDGEARRIAGELEQLQAKAEFPIQVQPVALVNSDAEAGEIKSVDCDAILLCASGGPVGWIEAIARSGKPAVMFLRHRSGPLYLYYEIAHFRFLRKSDDAMTEPSMTVDDIVVDDYGDVLWRLRALYGLKNTRGTRSLALGGLQSYTKTGQKEGPVHARGTWGMEIVEVPDAALKERVAKWRADSRALEEAERQAREFLAQPNLTLVTDRKFVVNSFLVRNLIRSLMKETNTTNVGVANCMGALIRLFDTPPCLVLSLLNDEGQTAFCHTDYTQTPAGVLLRWISGKPSFISNSHYPHHGLLTIAHCATPRKMDGRTYEPTKIVTHFESDYGAATRVEFTKGQVITNIIPNFACTKWFGIKGKIVDTPNHPTCRSQIDMEILGDWRRLLKDLEGFHTVTCYGDFLREVGYALKRTGIQWDNVSESG